MAITTQGSVRRELNEHNTAVEKITRGQLKRLKALQEQKNKKQLGLYKKTILESFLEVFSSNYGEEFDYNSLVNSLKFTTTIDKDGNIVPDFSFNENAIIYGNKISRNTQQFNENVSSDFLTLEDIEEGNFITRYNFDSAEEYEEYENGDILTSDIDEYDGMFIAVSSNEDRYGTFNRINKTAGYTTTSDSGKQAKQNALKRWQALNKIK